MLEQLVVVSLAINHNKSHSKLTNCISKRKQHVLHSARRLVHQDHQSDRTRISQHVIHLVSISSISHMHTINTYPSDSSVYSFELHLKSFSTISHFGSSMWLCQIFMSQESKYRNQLVDTAHAKSSYLTFIIKNSFIQSHCRAPFNHLNYCTSNQLQRINHSILQIHSIISQ